jgi:hypothetical protein
VFCPIASELVRIDSANYESALPPIVEHFDGGYVWIFFLHRDFVYEECNRKNFRACSSLELSHTLYPHTSAPSRRNQYLDLASTDPLESIEASLCHARWRALLPNQLGFQRPPVATIASPLISRDPSSFFRCFVTKMRFCHRAVDIKAATSIRNHSGSFFCPPTSRFESFVSLNGG